MVIRKGKEDDPVEKMRHSAAHVMADAVQQLYPGTKVTIGPCIESGFYYDFDRSEPFTQADLEAIERKMAEIIAADLPFVRQEVSRPEALELFRSMNEPYKVEIIDGLPKDQAITLYRHGEFVDLCRGPHVARTGEIKSVKLLSIAGAYWRGDEARPMLQRIYGTAFASDQDLQAHLKWLKEIAERDHRELGRKLDLFSSLEDKGPGLILWHPKGARIRRLIEEFWYHEHERAGYDLVYTPHAAKLDLWRTSGHAEFYRENMFATMDVDGQEFQLKPMNCPFHLLIYQSKQRSYRDLPLRFAELGTVYRYERSGVLHGLMRVRGFTQDDAHIFCRDDQLENEVGSVIGFVRQLLGTFGFTEFAVYLSTRPEKSVGSDEDWVHATAALRGALEKQDLVYEEDPGEGVFYGPKIDIKIKDVLGRMWQCSTIQVDFNLPKRFDIDYIASDGTKRQPIMVHRALMGSLERFFGILIEHYGGAFPLWLAPVQVALLTVTDAQVPYAQALQEAWRDHGIRVAIDDRPEKLGLKIRTAQMDKIPYSVVIGEKEAVSGQVAPRRYGEKEGLAPMGKEAFLSQLLHETKTKCK